MDTATAAPTIRAFVLGLKHYEAPNEPLKCSIHDAVDMARKLHGLGAVVTMMTDDLSDTRQRREMVKVLDDGRGGGDVSVDKKDAD